MTLDKSESYSVKSFTSRAYSLVYERALPIEVVDFIWQHKAPPRARFLLWFLAKNKLKTGAYLARFNIIQPQDNVCPLCKVEEETASHIFFTYHFLGKCRVNVLIGGRLLLLFIRRSLLTSCYGTPWYRLV